MARLRQRTGVGTDEHTPPHDTLWLAGANGRFPEGYHPNLLLGRQRAGWAISYAAIVADVAGGAPWLTAQASGNPASTLPSAWLFLRAGPVRPWESHNRARLGTGLLRRRWWGLPCRLGCGPVTSLFCGSAPERPAPWRSDGTPKGT